MRKTIASIIALYTVATLAWSPYWGNAPASLGDASMGYCKSGIVSNFFTATVKLPPGEHEAITIVGWYGHSATNSYVFHSNPMLTYTPLPVQLSNPDLLNGSWGDGIAGGTNLTSSFSSTNITFSTYTNHTIAATAWPHGVWTVAGWTSNACTLNLSGIDYTLGPGTFNKNLIAGGTHDCILTGSGLVSIGIAQTPCHMFYEAMEYNTGSGRLPPTMIPSTNGIYLYSIRLELAGTNHIGNYASRALNKDWTFGGTSTNSCPFKFSSLGIYQMMMNTWNNTEIKNETIFDYRVYPFRLTDEQLERIYQNGRDEVIRRGLGVAQTPPTPPPPAEPVAITFDYNYYDANIQATLEFASSNYPPAEAFSYLPTCTSLGGYSAFLEWRDSNNTAYTTSSIVPSSATTLHAAFTLTGASFWSLTFDLQSGSGDTPMLYLYEGFTFGAHLYGGNNFPSDPTYSGYIFQGWYTGTYGSGVRVYPSDVYNYSTWYGSVTLYAYWTPAPVTFYFNATEVNSLGTADYYSADYTPGQTFGSMPTPYPNTPTYEWYYTHMWVDGNGNYYDANSTVPSTGTTLYVPWYPVSPSGTLSFDLQSGSGSTSDIYLYDGYAFDEMGSFPSDPAYTTYTFSGWFTSTGGNGTRVYPADIYYYSTYYGNVTLYAYWVKTGGILSFDSQGGTPSSFSTSVLSDGQTFGSYSSFPSDPTCSGYACAGWFTGTSGSGTQIRDSDTYYFSTYNGDVTLYAYWLPAVSFSPNNYTTISTVIPLTDGQAFNYGGSFPDDPTFSNYIFEGWFYMGNRVYPSDTYYWNTYLSGLTLVANWFPALTFDLQGGTGDTPTIPLTYSLTYSYGGNFPADPTYSGYTFGGWFTGVNGSQTEIKPNDQNPGYNPLTVYAYWIPLLTFDLQGGTGDTPIIPLTSGQTYNYGGSFPSDPTLDGYTFGGWFTSPGGYGSGIYGYYTFSETSPVTLYAYWY